MAVHSVNYDLKKPGRDYQPLYDAIKKYQHCHALESTWLIDTTQTPAQVRDNLKKHIDANDKLLITRLQGNWATNYSDRCSDWLKKRFP